MNTPYGFRGYVTSDCPGIKTTYANPPAGHDWAPPGWTTNSGGDQAVWTNTASGKTVSGEAGGMAYALRAAGSLNCFGAGPAIPAYPVPGLRDLLGQESKLKYIREAKAVRVRLLLLLRAPTSEYPQPDPSDHR